MFNTSGQRLCYFTGIRNKQRVRISLATLFKQHFAIRTLTSGHKIDPIMLGRKGLDIRQTIGHLTTDRVIIVKDDSFLNTFLDFCHNLLKTTK